MYAFVFSFGLVYILFLGMELATSNMMYLSAGLLTGSSRFKDLVRIVLVSLIFNLVGALLISYIVSQTSLLDYVGQESLLVNTVASKLSRSSMDIFFGAIIANIFVNIGIMAYILVENEVAKITIILSAIFAFVYLGYDHVVANFSSFSLLYFAGKSKLVEGFDLLNILRQWIFAFLGNYVGGGIIVGMSMGYLERKDK